MPRWDYDTVFYRVFCLTLLGITFTFTVILTNVFIDIDGLLFKNNKVASERNVLQAEVNLMTPKAEIAAYDYRDYGNGEAYDAERTKRSVEMQDALKNFKDETIKKVLSSRLAVLLEDLEKEDKNKESQESEKKNNDFEKANAGRSKEVQVTDKEKTEKYTKEKDVELIDLNKAREDLVETEIMDYLKKMKQEKEHKHKVATEEEMRHLAMHNIILQGIVGHMDLNEVYNKMHALINRLDSSDLSNIKKDVSDAIFPTENTDFLDELVNCKQLKKQIDDETKPETVTDTTEKSKKGASKPSKKVMIKTIIDISSHNDKNNQHETSNENVNGIIKLIYNGKALKFKRFDEVSTTEKTKSEQLTYTNEALRRKNKDLFTTPKTTKQDTYVPKKYTSKIISDYLKKMSEAGGLFNETKFSKRLKRHINIQFDNEDSTTKKTTHVPGPNKDDELFLEIETHFNSKGLKGDEKKKMIRDLIEKIQKAIRTEKESLDDRPKKHKHLHVKKRTQNPLDKPLESHIKAMAHEKPVYFLVHRDSDPISKSVPLHDKMPLVTDHRGDFWRQKKNQPRFLGKQKGINSIEMGELNAEYTQGPHNMIPEREQKPLNIQSLYPIDPRSAKFVMKDIAGSGFSIGFNQYIDDPPDADSMNLFSGIENIIKTYHQKYDEEEGANAKLVEQIPIPRDIPRMSVNQEYPPNQYPENQEYLSNQEYPGNRESGYYENQDYPPESNQHTIVRRSIENIKRDFHSDEYKIIYKNKINNKNKNNKENLRSKSLRLNNNFALHFIDDNIFSKDLKPSEILSLATILGRKKRTINVKKISNLHNHRSLNRYLNTNSMASKRIFKQNKRSKRQLDKIRIVAKDRSMAQSQRQNSAEEIFVLSSNENMFSDRALLKDIASEVNDDHRNNDNEHYDIVSSPSKQSEEHYDVISPQKQPATEYINNQQDVAQEPYYVVPQMSPQVQMIPPQEPEELDGAAAYDIRGQSSERNIDADFFIRRSRHNSLMSKYPHIIMDELTKSKEDYRPEAFIYERVDEKIPDRVEVTSERTIQIPQEQYALQTAQKDSEMQDLLYTPSGSNYKLTVKILPKNNTGFKEGFKETHTSINKSYNKNGLIYTSLVNVSEISKVEKIKSNETVVKPTIPHAFIKKLNKQQTKMRSIIHQHKTRIEEQLAHLIAEKEKLLNMEVKNADLFREPLANYENRAAPSNGDEAVLLNKNRINKMEVEEAITESVLQTTQQPYTQPSTTETIPPKPTTEHVETNTEDILKSNIIKKIDRNELMTDEILKKIDKNTAILEKFLEKIVNKISTSVKETTTTNPPEYNAPETSYYRYELRQPKLDPQMPQPDNFFQKIPQEFFSHTPYSKVNTSVPFVYAFQHPYILQNSKDKNMPVANVVYHGHIHTQALPNAPELTYQSNTQAQPFPERNAQDQNQNDAQSDQKENTEKENTIENKPVDENYQDLQTLKTDEAFLRNLQDTAYQAANLAQRNLMFQEKQNRKSMNPDYQNMQAMKTGQNYPNMDTVASDRKYENMPATKTERNYENKQAKQPNQNYSIKMFKTNQNLDNIQGKKPNQNYDAMRSLKIEQKYDRPPKQWKEKNDKELNDKKWKKSLREGKMKKPVDSNDTQKNNTKFFIDELENEFKVIPVDGKKNVT